MQPVWFLIVCSGYEGYFQSLLSRLHIVALTPSQCLPLSLRKFAMLAFRGFDKLPSDSAVLHKPPKWPECWVKDEHKPQISCPGPSATDLSFSMKKTSLQMTPRWQFCGNRIYGKESRARSKREWAHYFNGNLPLKINQVNVSPLGYIEPNH